MCHYLGGQLPLSGLTSLTSNGPFMANQSNVVPLNQIGNLIQGTQVTLDNLMNNCLWILKTSDILEAKLNTSDLPGYHFKARPLLSKRQDNF